MKLVIKDSEKIDVVGSLFGWERSEVVVLDASEDKIAKVIIQYGRVRVVEYCTEYYEQKACGGEIACDACMVCGKTF